MSAFIWKKKKTLKINNNQFGKSQIQAIKKKKKKQQKNKQTGDKEKHKVKRNDLFILWELMSFSVPNWLYTAQCTTHKWTYLSMKKYLEKCRPKASPETLTSMASQEAAVASQGWRFSSKLSLFSL